MKEFREIFTRVVLICLISIPVAGFIFKISKLLGDTESINLVTLSAGIISGILTLLGVILTINFSIKMQEKNNIDSHVPEFYAPIRFDIHDAIQIQMANDETLNQLSNHRIYFKNTDFCSFRIDSICVGGKNMLPSAVTFIDKNVLFCINFCCKGKLDNIFIKVESTDKNFYFYKAQINRGNCVDLRRL